MIYKRNIMEEIKSARIVYNKIPKIIHYCWFGRKKPKKVIKAINEWRKKCPDYQIIEWNESNFKIDEACDFVKEAYNSKKWAFVSDFVRLNALLNCGGIYLDTDVQLLNNFDAYLDEDMFISHESEKSFCTAVIGAKKGNEFIKSFLETYKEKKFIIDGTMDERPNSELIKSFADSLFENSAYDEEYLFESIHIYPQTYFCGKNIFNYKLLITDNTVSIHHLDASWYNIGHKVLRCFKKIVMWFLNLFRK